MERETAEWKGRVEKESEERKGERDVAPSPERGTLCLTNPAREASCSRPAVPTSKHLRSG